jgi:hypothetical protein
LFARLRPLVTKKQPIEAPRPFPKARGVKPSVMIDVEFRGKTGAGLLRHPSYQGVRDDLTGHVVQPRLRALLAGEFALAFWGWDMLKSR